MTAETSVPSTALLAGADRDGSNYTARHLLVLEGLEAVRKRPGMYIGSTDSRGLMHCLWEIIDNSVDEALGGYCDHIEVILHDDGSVEVRDNGRGIPVDVEPKTGLSGVEVVMTKLHAGGKFGGGSYAASGGLHGVGASVVNALSARLDVEVDRSGHTHAISFRRGVPGSFAAVGQPLRLVLYLSGDLLEFRLELAAVVGAEEQFSAAQQDDAQVCLGAAAVAAIGGRQWARGGQNSSHVASSLARRAVVPGSTSNQPENVPARGFSSKKSSRGGCLLPVGGECAVLRVYVSVRVRAVCRGRSSRLACRLFMRTCPEPKWFMPRRERDMYFTPSRDRTGIRPWTSREFRRGWRYNGSTRPRYPLSGNRSRALTHKGPT